MELKCNGTNTAKFFATVCLFLFVVVGATAFAGPPVTNYWFGFGPQFRIEKNGVITYFTEGQYPSNVIASMGTQNAYSAAKIPGLVVAFHGVNPWAVANAVKYIPPGYRGFIDSASCGADLGKCDPESWARAGYNSIGTKKGYVLYNWTDEQWNPTGSVRAYGKLKWHGWWTGKNTLVDPAEAMVSVAKGPASKVKDLRQYQRTVTNNCAFWTPEGWKLGTRKDPTGKCVSLDVSQLKVPPLAGMSSSPKMAASCAVRTVVPVVAPAVVGTVAASGTAMLGGTPEMNELVGTGALITTAAAIDLAATGQLAAVGTAVEATTGVGVGALGAAAGIGTGVGVVVGAGMIGYTEYVWSGINGDKKLYLEDWIDNYAQSFFEECMAANQNDSVLCNRKLKRRFEAESIRYDKDLLVGNECPWWALWCRR